jgi:hypothetical protein
MTYAIVTEEVKKNRTIYCSKPFVGKLKGTGKDKVPTTNELIG